MSAVIDLRAYLGEPRSRLLVLVDLQIRNYEELAHDPLCDIRRALENCMAAIQHARANGLPIAFTRLGEDPHLGERSEQSAWIPGFEPKRSDMVFERQRPSCYANRLFDNIVSQSGSFALAGLMADEACLATAIDAAHRGHQVTFLGDAAVSRGRPGADARSVHAVTTKAMELFADVRATRRWVIATSPSTTRGHRYG
jgi:nicotinamidase-related amidase